MKIEHPRQQSLVLRRFNTIVGSSSFYDYFNSCLEARICLCHKANLDPTATVCWSCGTSLEYSRPYLYLR